MCYFFGFFNLGTGKIYFEGLNQTYSKHFPRFTFLPFLFHSVLKIFWSVPIELERNFKHFR